MTNYERLASKGALESFLIDVHNLSWEEIHSAYNIPSTTSPSRWLQSNYVGSMCYIIQVDYVSESPIDAERAEVFKIRKIIKDDLRYYTPFLFKTYDTLAEAYTSLANYLMEHSSNE